MFILSTVLSLLVHLLLRPLMKAHFSYEGHIGNMLGDMDDFGHSLAAAINYAVTVQTINLALYDQGVVDAGTFMRDSDFFFKASLIGDVFIVTLLLIPGLWIIYKQVDTVHAKVGSWRDGSIVTTRYAGRLVYGDIARRRAMFRLYFGTPPVLLKWIVFALYKTFFAIPT